LWLPVERSPAGEAYRPVGGVVDRPRSYVSTFDSA
jgi:hypothetical protein